MIQREFRELLVSAFNEGELVTLCADLQIDYSNLPGVTKEDKARELIAYQERRGLMSELAAECQRLRPNLSWPSSFNNERRNHLKNHNPYSWNTVNPEICYGRNEILDEMLNHLPGNPRQSFGISGARRIGKTTLLRRVELELKAEIDQWHYSGLKVIPIYIDGLALPRPLYPSDVWAIILKNLQVALPQQFHVPEHIDFDTFKTVIKPVLLNLQDIPRIIVIFDEIEPIIICDWSDSFLAHWRALLGNTPGLSEFFTAVFAGAREMTALRQDIGSPLKDILEWHNLQAFDYEDTCQLMQEPIDRLWPERFLKKVYTETGGHPMLLQYLMQKMYEKSFEEIDIALDSAIQEFFQKRRWQFSEWWERYCTKEAQLIYMRLPDNSESTTLRSLVQEFGTSITHDALDILQHVGIACAEDAGFSYRYNGEMFRRWYKQYGMLAEISLHDPELYTRLLQIGDILAAKYLSAWKIFNTDLPNYSSAVGEMRDVLTHLLDFVAPIKEVILDPNFEFEYGQQKPTRRQRVRFAARKFYDSNLRTNEISSDFDILEINAEQLAQITTNAYRLSSGLTHTIANRDNAYRVLKQWENILVQLLPPQILVDSVDTVLKVKR